MLQKVTQVFQEYYCLRLSRIRNFVPKTIVDQKYGSFRLKTADTIEELKQVFRLRHEVLMENLQDLPKFNVWDNYDYDFQCDHLALIDEKTNTLIGSSRLFSNKDSRPFYTSRLFNINRILAHKGLKTEFSHTCLRKEYRHEVALSLLLKGLVIYMQKSKSQMLFGSTNFSLCSPREAALLHRYFFEQKRYSAEYYSSPTLAYTMPDFNLWCEFYKRPLNFEERVKAATLISPSCKAYLNLGAYLGGEPAWDIELQSLNFLTILNRKSLKKPPKSNHV